MCLPAWMRFLFPSSPSSSRTSLSLVLLLQMKTTERVEVHHARTIEESKKRAEAEQRRHCEEHVLEPHVQYVGAFLSRPLPLSLSCACPLLPPLSLSPLSPAPSLPLPCLARVPLSLPFSLLPALSLSPLFFLALSFRVRCKRRPPHDNACETSVRGVVSQ